MELSGNLSDFALSDILQILALSRKTGTLLLEADDLSGKVVIEDGRITHASLIPGETFADRLLKERRVGEEDLRVLTRIGEGERSVWPIDALVVESGMMGRGELSTIAKRHIEATVEQLVRLPKGRFWIELNKVVLEPSSTEIRLIEGVEVGEVLLGAAKRADEAKRCDSGEAAQRESDNPVSELPSWSLDVNAGNSELLGGPEVGAGEISDENYWPVSLREEGVKKSILCSLLMELGSSSFDTEVSLLIMRYASEVASRGILFVVKGDEMIGLGQFGLQSQPDGVSADERVRRIRIGLRESNIFSEVALSRRPYVGRLPDGYRETEVLDGIGGGAGDLIAFLLPLGCQGKTMFVIYGDNFPGVANMAGLDELVALVNQASIVLEKMVLEQRLRIISGMGMV
jgi:uncharacterized protein DUF4388